METRIEVVFGEEPKEAMQELVEDLISILDPFSEKLYGMRSNKYEKAKRCIEEIKA